MPRKFSIGLALTLALLLLQLGACSKSPNEIGGDTALVDVGDVENTDASGDDAGDVIHSRACPGPDDTPTEDAYSIGEWTLALTPASGAWRVLRGEEFLLQSAGSCGGDPLRLHRGTPSVNNQFGAFRINLDPPGADASWEVIDTPPTRVESTESSVSLLWDLEEGDTTVRLNFAIYGDGDLEIGLGSSDANHHTGELAWRCQPEESFFGLGTQVVGMDLRGRTYPLWTQEQGNSKPEGGGAFPLNNIPEAAYAPMGVLFSSAGYAGLVGHDGYHEIDLCHVDAEALRLRSHPLLPSIVLVTGDSPKEQVESVTRYVGRITEPPDWVFGPWNDAVGGPERMWDVARTLRENDIPSSAMWAEDWIGGALTSTGFRLSYRWAWDPETYPDLPADIANLQAQGFAFLAYFNPFIPTTVPTYEEGASQGFLIKRADGTPYTFRDPAFRVASLVDLSNPEAEAWLKGYLRRAAGELRIDGWMADFAEWLPVDAVLTDDVDPWLFHNRYPMEWQRIHREVFEEVVPRQAGEASNNWTFFARSGWGSVNGGTAGLAPTLWGGDQNTDWKYDDGLPTIIPMAAHVGLAGVAIFGSDIAGYSSLTSPNTDKELFLRWSAIGAFHPLMRTHHGSEKCDNWMFDRDAETLAHYRRYAKIHTLLLPFWQGLARDAVERGLPIIRHPYLVEPHTARLWQGRGYQFFLGDDLLVAPVIDQGELTRRVVLPDGQWWPIFGDEPIEAEELTVDAAVTEIPVFVRAGTILPLLIDTVDSFYGAQTEGVTDLSDIAGQFRLVLYPDGAGDLAEISVGAATVTGSQWMMNSFEEASFSIDDEPLPACSDPLPAQSCRDGDTIYLVGDRFTLRSSTGGALTVTSETVQTYRVAIGGRGWAPFDAPTLVTDLDPETRSYCETDGAEQD